MPTDPLWSVLPEIACSCGEPVVESLATGVVACLRCDLLLGLRLVV
jgi:hypothetical protein